MQRNTDKELQVRLAQIKTDIEKLKSNAIDSKTHLVQITDKLSKCLDIPDLKATDHIALVPDSYVVVCDDSKWELIYIDYYSRINFLEIDQSSKKLPELQNLSADDLLRIEKTINNYSHSPKGQTDKISLNLESSLFKCYEIEDENTKTLYRDTISKLQKDLHDNATPCNDKILTKILCYLKNGATNISSLLNHHLFSAKPKESSEYDELMVNLELLFIGSCTK